MNSFQIDFEDRGFWLPEFLGLRMLSRSIGEPQKLATSGVLGRFVERKGIHFDSDTMTINIDKTA